MQVLSAHGWRCDKAPFFNLPVVSFMILLDILLQIPIWRAVSLVGRKMGSLFPLSNSMTFAWTALILDYIILLLFLFWGTMNQRDEALLKYNAEHTEKKMCVKYRIIRLLKEWLWLMKWFQLCSSNSRGSMLWNRNKSTRMPEQKMSKQYFVFLPLLQS